MDDSYRVAPGQRELLAARRRRRDEQGSVPRSTSVPRVSVIVPAYNAARTLGVALDALERQTYPRDRYEVIVVDNDSEDDLIPLRGRFPNVVWTFEATPGSYHARNRGIMHARGEILAFTDADCIPDPAWLREGVRALAASDHIGLVGGRIDIVIRDAGHPTVCELYDWLNWAPQHEAITNARCGITANLFTTRRVVDTVGPFDGRMRSGGDRNWGNRVHAAGLQLEYCAGALVRHPARRTLGAVIDRALRIAVAPPISGSRYSVANLRRRMFRRVRRMWTEMTTGSQPVGHRTRWGVLGLYFGLKGLQSLERVRVRWGTPRR